MGKYLIRRLLIAIPSLIGISVILFAVLALAPGDPFEELASNPNVPAEVAANLRKQFGLDDPVMVRYVRWAGSMVVGIDLAGHEISGAKITEHVAAGADRLQVRQCLARLGALIGLEQVLRDDHAGHAHEGIGPERRGPGEGDANGVAVDLLGADVTIAADCYGCGGGIGSIFPIENHVIGGEGLTIVPLNVALQLPHHRLAVGGDTAVLNTRHFRRKDGHEVGVAVPGRERLVEHAAAILVLGADSEMRIQQRRTLPHQQLEGTAATALRGLIAPALLRVRYPRMHEHLPGHGHRQPGPDHHFDEAAARHAARLDLVYQLAKVTFVHLPLPVSLLQGTEHAQ